MELTRHIECKSCQTLFSIWLAHTALSLFNNPTTQMSPHSDFLLPLVPLLPPDEVVGHSAHTCITKVNLGIHNPIKMGMKSHYMSVAITIIHCQPVVHLPPSVEFADTTSSMTLTKPPDGF
jgi:hypothetical protein